MQHPSTFSQLYDMGQQSTVPVIFISLLSRFYDLKDEYELLDEDFEISSEVLELNLINSIFETQFTDHCVAEVVMVYCIAVSIIKILLDAEDDLQTVKRQVEFKRDELEHSRTAWPQFMPYVGDEEKYERSYQQSYQQLIIYEEVVEQIQQLAKRAFQQLDQRLDKLQSDDQHSYWQALEQIAWVEEYFRDENQTKRIELLIQSYSSN